MTHLRIENQNSNTEIVNAAIILKLYEMALSDEGNVLLKGNLLSDHAYQSALTYLNDKTKFPNLLINVPVGAEYIDFVDPVAQAAFSRVWGDGNGITMSQLNAIGNYLLGHNHWEPILNDLIVWLDEFKYTSVTNIWPGAIAGGSLYWINLLNVISLGYLSLVGQRNLCSRLMAHCDNLTTLGKAPFRGSKFENNNTIIMPPNLTSFNSMVPSWIDPAPVKIYFLNTTPPTFIKDLAFDACVMYVPTGCINVYKQAVIDAGYSNANFITWLEYDWETDPDGWLNPVVIPDSL